MTSGTRSYKKIAYIVSLLIVVAWAVLGTGTSLAWFTDTSNEVRNIFHAAEFDMKVSWRREDTAWDVLDGEEAVFDDEALYEPGYTQTVYLEVKNEGNIPFTFDTAVSVTDYTDAFNVFGLRFNLQDYLRFGLVSADTEEELTELVKDRETAKQAAVSPLNNYYVTDKAVLQPDATKYFALVVRMPEEVGNEANYRGERTPRVELGVIVSASQITD